VIVKFRDGATAAEQAAALERAGVVQTLGTIRGLGSKIVRVRGDAREAAAALQRSPAVQYAELDKILTAAAAIPNDPQFAAQYALEVIKAPEGWAAAGLGGLPATGGAKVGIIDTGIERSHPEFAGRVSDCGQSTSLVGVGTGVREGCADVDGHGTKVAGILGARANNGVGVTGVAFNSPLAICRALEDGVGRGSTSNIVNCINWLRARGAKVISMSFGGANTTTLHNAIKSAWNNGRGAVLLAAAGNGGGYTTSFPAGYPEVISVASTDAADGWWGSSNRNADVEVAAPGVDILTTALNGGYAFGTGTSAATPYAAGVAAVMRTHFPWMRATGVRYWLGWATDDLGEPGRDSYYGFGRVNLCRSITGEC
jgi:thermitase